MKHGWEYKRLMDVCNSTSNIQWSKESKSYSYVDLTSVDRESHCITETSSVNKDNAPSRAKQWIKTGDVLFGTTRPMLKRVCLIDESYDNQVCSTGFSVLRPSDSLMPKWVFYQLLSDRFYTYIEPLQTGITYPAVSDKDVRSFVIPAPPIDEQKAICSLLDKLSLVIEKKKQQVKELDNLAQAIFYDMFGDPVENEKGWEIVEMRALFDIGSSKRVFESQWTEEGVPFYRAREIVRLSRDEPIESPIFISEPLFKEYSIKYGIPSEGDIMVTAVGTLGVCYLVKKTDRFYFKDGNLLWFKNKGVCDTRFIKDQFTTDFVKNQIQGNANAAVVGTFTITNANKTMVVLPPLNLQKEYVSKVEAIDRQKELINQSIREAQTLFDSRMEYYFGE